MEISPCHQTSLLQHLIIEGNETMYVEFQWYKLMIQNDLPTPKCDSVCMGIEEQSSQSYKDTHNSHIPVPTSTNASFAHQIITIKYSRLGL